MWWIEVDPAINGKTLEIKDDRHLMAKVARKMYEHLKSARDYRFALAGVA
jgi:hypothetical protein